MASERASAKIHDSGDKNHRGLAARRAPPADSKSLPAHLKQELVRQGVETAQAQDPSKQKSKQLRQGDTQDSNGSDESASRWFDKANERGPQGQRESPSTNGMSALGYGYLRQFLLTIDKQSLLSSLAMKSSTTPTISYHPAATMTCLGPTTMPTVRTRIFVESLMISPWKTRD